ncbi:EAL domain-containing protein [Frankia sp. AgB32]|uniref:putative bifunctional diguanylate cyclase/phosphodiesterase n=1 Tax=Frankia sp. AgB32 TaxID=631119 RepID=UPI00200D0552|nr:EAL domain-containing protein [Frankia sp. AgB32]MCK9894667.1 EAL domain-containing protein [Frankia sp. AgB32]
MTLVDAATIVAGLAATLSCVWAGHRLDRARGRWLIWLSLALSSWTVAQVAGVLHRWERASAGRRTIAEVGYLADAGQFAMPVLALVALAAVPASRARRSRDRATVLAAAVAAPAGSAAGRRGRDDPRRHLTAGPRPAAPAGLVGVADWGGRFRAARGLPGLPVLALDEMILAGSLFLLTWSGLLAGLGSTDLDGSLGRSATGHLVAVAHVLAVLVMVLAVLHVAGFRQPVDLPAVVAAGTGLVFLALVGLLCTHLGDGGDGEAGSVSGSAAVVGALLVVLAAVRAGWAGQGRRADDPDPRAELAAWLRLAAPYLAVAGVAAFLLGRSRGGIALDPVEIAVGAVLVAAVFIRQMLALRANQRLATVLGDTERETRHWISHDPLTELANRGLFHQRLATALAASRHDGRDVAVVYCDLDDFRVINDSLGHAAGDHLLRAVGQRLRHCVRTTDTVARLGSDEFALLLDGGQELPEQVAERVLTALRQPVAVGGHHWPVRASVGLVVAGRTQVTTEALLRRADTALHAAKQTGKNRLVVYRPGLGATPGAQLVAGTHLADALATALRRGGWSAGFAVHYQPIVRLRDRVPVALEALARWTAPGRGPVPPGTFVAAAESSGIVGTLDDMILGQACAEIAVAYPDSALRLHVNVSASRVADTTLLDSVARALATSRLDPRRLVVEITETSRLNDLDGAREVLEEVRALGVAVALDDVGAGHSTLAALHLLPVDVVKLDRTLLEPPPDGGRVVALRRSMINLAHALGAVVVAEGIEREGQIAELAELGCELGQGFLFARPGPLPTPFTGSPRAGD